MACGSSQKIEPVKDLLRRQAEKIVEERQKLIKFNDDRKSKLIEVEYRYLKAVEKAKNCKSCSNKKLIEKSTKTRDRDLQKYLPRSEYIKYKSIDDNLLDKDVPLYSN